MYYELDHKKYSALRLSKDAISTLSWLFENGYEFSRAEVRFLVYWYPQDKPAEEGLIVLPDLYLKKKLISEN